MSDSDGPLSLDECFPTLSAIASRFPCHEVALVAVVHAIDTAPLLLQALSRGIPIHSAIPVPYSIRPGVITALAKHVEVTTLEDGSTGEAIARAVESAAKKYRRVILQDVGGWGAAVLDRLASIPEFVGVVEDTNQGHWRYEALAPCPVPVISVAQSPLKKLENVRIGDAVAFSLESALRTDFGLTLSELTIAVLGFGGVGAAVASSLRRRGAQVLIYDPDPVKMTQALVLNFRAAPREEVLRSARVVVGASGSRSVSLRDAAHLKDRTILASASSRNLEFADWHTSPTVARGRMTPNCGRYTYQGQTIFMVNNGFPINFSHDSRLGSVLDLIFTEVYACIRELLLGKNQCGLTLSTPQVHQLVANEWLSTRRRMSGDSEHHGI